jgi:hypothetical protein
MVSPEPGYSLSFLLLGFALDTPSCNRSGFESLNCNVFAAVITDAIDALMDVFQ